MKNYSIRKANKKINMAISYSTVLVNITEDSKIGTTFIKPFAIWNANNGFTIDYIELTQYLNDTEVTNLIEQILIKEIR